MPESVVVIPQQSRPKPYVDPPKDDMLSQGLELLKVGAANPVVSGSSIFLVVTALGSIKTGITTKAPVLSIPQQIATSLGAVPSTLTGIAQLELSLGDLVASAFGPFGAGFDLVHQIFNLVTGTTPPTTTTPPTPTPQTLVTPAPDGMTTDPTGKVVPYWNTYLLNAADATNLKLAILAYIIGTGVSGATNIAQLSSLISTGVAALK